MGVTAKPRWRSSRTAAIVAGALIVSAAFIAGLLLGRGSTGAPEPFDLRPSEVVGPDVEVTDGTMRFRVLAWRCGLLSVAGDHADWLPDGQYCRLRLRITNVGRPLTDYEAAAQELIDAEGRHHPADLNSVQISDQPTSLKVGLHSSTELDVWFDVPEDAVIEAARLHATDGSEGVVVPLRK